MENPLIVCFTRNMGIKGEDLKMQISSKEINDCSLPAVKKILEGKLVTLEKELSANLKEKRSLELRINEQYKKIRKMKASIEKIEPFCEETWTQPPKSSKKISQ